MGCTLDKDHGCLALVGETIVAIGRPQVRLPDGPCGLVDSTVLFTGTWSGFQLLVSQSGAAMARISAKEDVVLDGDYGTSAPIENEWEVIWPAEATLPDSVSSVQELWLGVGEGAFLAGLTIRGTAGKVIGSFVLSADEVEPVETERLWSMAEQLLPMYGEARFCHRDKKP